MERHLPESVRGMIEYKIAQLAEPDHRLLAAASVQGYEFGSTVAARALALDEAEVEERLESLESIHVFVQLIEEREFPVRTLTLRYRFTHVLYQNALYAALCPARRASLSAAVAQALLSLYGEKTDAVASELARLFETARDFMQAAEYYRLAARSASCWLRQGEANQTEAASQLAALCSWFKERSNTADLQQARALLATISAG